MIWGPLANRAASKLGMAAKGNGAAKPAAGATPKMAKPSLRKPMGGAMSKMTKGRY